MAQDNKQALLKEIEGRLASNDGDKWSAALERFIRQENPASTWKVWRTIRTQYLPKHRIIELFQLKKQRGDWKGKIVNDHAYDILNNPNFEIEAQSRTLDLVLVQAAELGLKKESRTDSVLQFLNRAQEFGFELCPPEVGPLLFWDDKGISRSNDYSGALTIGMKPIMCRDDSNSYDHPRLFFMFHTPSGEFVLDGSYSGPESWNGPYVFVLPKKTA